MIKFFESSRFIDKDKYTDDQVFRSLQFDYVKILADLFNGSISYYSNLGNTKGHVISNCSYKLIESFFDKGGLGSADYEVDKSANPSDTEDTVCLKTKEPIISISSGDIYLYVTYMKNFNRFYIGQSRIPDIFYDESVQKYIPIFYYSSGEEVLIDGPYMEGDKVEVKNPTSSASSLWNTEQDYSGRTYKSGESILVNIDNNALYLVV